MSSNLIYEITQMMRDTDSFHSNMNDAMNVVQTMFKEKYINKIQKAIQTHQLDARNNPTKEIQLMSALRPFMPETNRKSMDQMIDMMMTLHAAGNIQRELMDVNRNPNRRPYQTASQNVSASSIHDDGVYDVDDACMADKQQFNDNLPGLMFAIMMSNMK